MQLFWRLPTYVQDRPVAVGTPGAEQIVVVGLAVRLSIPLEEVPRAQLLGAVRAGKVLRVPGLSQRGDDLSDDGLLAGVATALLAGINPLAAHVGLKVSKHGIQVLFGWRCRRTLGGLSGLSVRRIGDRVVLGIAGVDLEQSTFRPGAGRSGLSSLRSGCRTRSWVPPRATLSPPTSAVPYGVRKSSFQVE